MFRNLSLAFSAGCLGGLANSIVVWASGTLGITAALGVKIAPALTLPWLYPRIVWGGIWGFLFVISIPGLSWWMRGLVFSLGPSLVLMLVLFPRNPLVGEFRPRPRHADAGVRPGVQRGLGPGRRVVAAARRLSLRILPLRGLRDTIRETEPYPVEPQPHR